MFRKTFVKCWQVYTFPCIYLHKWWYKCKSKEQPRGKARDMFGGLQCCKSDGWKQAEKAFYCCGENKLSLSQIPSYQCGHGGSTLISFFWSILKESVVLFCQIKIISPFWIPLWPIFRQQLTDLMLAQCSGLMNSYIDACLIWYSICVDRSRVGSGIVSLSVSTAWSRCGFSPPLSTIIPEWKLKCHTNIIDSLVASLTAVTAG